MSRRARGTVVLAVVAIVVTVAAIIARRSGKSDANLLIEAARDGDANRCESLVHSGIPIDAMDREGNTALNWAAFECHPRVVAKLLELRADVNHANELGFTPLICTSFPLEGHKLRGTEAERNEIAAMLIQHGADVNRAAGEGRALGSGKTPLHYAATSKNPGLVRMLLAAGADRNAKSKQGYTPLDVAKFSDYAPNDEVIALLEGRKP